MNILFVASEMEPLARVGGLADVIGTLPKRLAAQGADVRVVLPYYSRVKTWLSTAGIKPKDAVKDLVVCIDWLPVRGVVKEIKLSGVTVYLVEQDDFYARKYIYSTPAADYEDNDLRFGFLSLAALEAAKSLGFKPEIIHCHDWQTALLPICLRWRKHLRDDEFFKDTRVVFTIHNISFQGQYDRTILDKFGLPEFLFTSQGLEFYGKANLLKGGILYSDVVTTVSPTYAEEIRKKEYAYGLDAVLKWVSRKQDNLIGILNGIDYDEWDPETDRYIYKNYGTQSLAQKPVNREKLREEFGLDASIDKPVLGVVSKLTEQKGADLLLESVPQIIDLGYQIVIVGAGDEKYEQAVVRAGKRFGKNLSVTIAVDNTSLERKVYAGSDMFLVPSRFEPCGLGQIIALRYGTVPVVRGTGGLLDTVRDYTENPAGGNGFIFYEFSTVSMLDALLRAITAYEDKAAWRKLQTRAMREDFSWKASGKKYLGLYKEVMERKPAVYGAKH
ncbi:MAG TPA: glycogen synthase GlgA [Thermodesulfobacteriota bacterium]|nr:glycogen synthase GlgA [Thermodesulfobacteriota bacterium]